MTKIKQFITWVLSFFKKKENENLITPEQDRAINKYLSKVYAFYKFKQPQKVGSFHKIMLEGKIRDIKVEGKPSESPDAKGQQIVSYIRK